MPTEERLAEIHERCAAATPGPWVWRGHGVFRSFYLRTLATGYHGIEFMSFARWGTQGAQPVFVTPPLGMHGPRMIGRKIKASELAIRAQPHNDWDITGIDHPDARFIEHSRADVEWLLAEVTDLKAQLQDAQHIAVGLFDALEGLGLSWRDFYYNAEPPPEHIFDMTDRVNPSFHPEVVLTINDYREALAPVDEADADGE